MKLDLTKPVRCKNGRAARIICTDAKLIRTPLIALIQNTDPNDPNNELLELYSLDGIWNPHRETGMDLINID